MKEKLWCEHNKNMAGVYSKCEACNPSPQPEEWSVRFDNVFAHNYLIADESIIEDVHNRIKSFIKTEIRKAEENAKTNILRELKQMADKEVKISMVAGEIIQVRQLEVIQTVAKLHNIML